MPYVGEPVLLAAQCTALQLRRTGTRAEVQRQHRPTDSALPSRSARPDAEQHSASNVRLPRGGAGSLPRGMNKPNLEDEAWLGSRFPDAEVQRQHWPTDSALPSHSARPDAKQQSASEVRVPRGGAESPPSGMNKPRLQDKAWLGGRFPDAKLRMKGEDHLFWRWQMMDADGNAVRVEWHYPQDIGLPGSLEWIDGHDIRHQEDVAMDERRFTLINASLASADLRPPSR